MTTKYILHEPDLTHKPLLSDHEAIGLHLVEIDDHFVALMHNEIEIAIFTSRAEVPLIRQEADKVLMMEAVKW